MEKLSVDRALSKAMSHERNGQMDEARKCYGSILEVFPEDISANQGLARLAQLKPGTLAGKNSSDEILDQLVALYKKGQFRTVTQECDRLTKEFPQSFRLWNLLGAAFKAQGKHEEAIDAYNKTLLIKPEYAEAHYNMAGALEAQGKHEEAIDAYSKALLIKPGLAEAHNNMGAAFKAQGNHEEAIDAYSEALLIKPEYAEAHYNMGTSFEAQEKFEEAIAAYNKALLIKPGLAQAHYNMGRAFKAQGKHEEAIDAYSEALLIKPEYAEAHYNIGGAFTAQGKLEEAIDAYSEALLIKPEYAEAHYNMGTALTNHGKFGEAIDAYNKALLIKPEYAEAHYNMGITFEAQEKFEEAIDAYSEALLIKPEYAEAYYNMSLVFQAQGEHKEALFANQKALLIKPDYVEVYRHLGTLKKYTYSDPQKVQMEKLYAGTNISDEDRCHLCFALAKSSEDLGNLEEAFRYLKEGNALRKRFLNYDIVQDEEIFSKIKETANSFKNVFFNVSQKENFPTPILILGMPRSGTTLVEQIISNHSKVTAAGELRFLKMFGSSLAEGEAEVTSESLKKVRNQYLDELVELSADQPLVTDKMPANFFYIGLICSALPEAKIVHVQRDPTATCWSNYKQYFAENGLGYSYDLLDVVHYYQMYQDLMLFWGKHYPENMYHLNYEQLTTDQESETKKLIEYLGIDWEDACLSPEKNRRYVKTTSNMQVREKIYKGSSEEWKKFEKYLDGAFNELPN